MEHVFGDEEFERSTLAARTRAGRVTLLNVGVSLVIQLNGGFRTVVVPDNFSRTAFELLRQLQGIAGQAIEGWRIVKAEFGVVALAIRVLPGVGIGIHDVPRAGQVRPCADATVGLTGVNIVVAICFTQYGSIGSRPKVRRSTTEVCRAGVLVGLVDRLVHAVGLDDAQIAVGLQHTDELAVSAWAFVDICTEAEITSLGFHHAVGILSHGGAEPAKQLSVALGRQESDGVSAIFVVRQGSTGEV